MLPQFMEIMEYSFPYNERRLPEYYDNYLKNTNNELVANLYLEDSKLIGFLTYWRLLNFTFIEHFAVSREYRNRNIGSKIFSDFIEHSDSSLILEVEPPCNEIAQRRITFYERLGLVVNPYKYIQSPYHNDANSLDMLLMSSRLLSPDEFLSVRNEIYVKVYNVS